MSDYQDDMTIFVQFSHSFKALRVIDKYLLNSEWDIKFDVFFNEAYDDDAVNNSLNKIRFWFDNILTNSIIFSKSNSWAYSKFYNFDSEQGIINNICVTPFEPTDDFLAPLIQAKANALAEHNLYFNSAELTSKDAKGLNFCFMGDPDELLPTTKEWVEVDDYIHDEPWWHRNDGSTVDLFDFDFDNDDIPNVFYDLSFLGETIKHEQENTAKIIRRNFKPRIIKE